MTGFLSSTISCHAVLGVKGGLGTSLAAQYSVVATNWGGCPGGAVGKKWSK